MFTHCVKTEMNWGTRTKDSEIERPMETPSLVLRGVKLQDLGRYRCYASTTHRTENSYILLKVDGKRNDYQTPAYVFMYTVNTKALEKISQQEAKTSNENGFTRGSGLA